MSLLPLSRKDIILERLRHLVLTHMPVPGEVESAIPGFFLVRKNEPTPCLHCLATPRMALLIQGEKLICLGRQEDLAKPGQSIITCIETPSSSTILDIDPAQPFLSIYFLLNKNFFVDLLSEIAGSSPHGGMIPQSYIFNTPSDFMETLLRLTELLEKPEEARFLGPMILKELHYMLLASPYGATLRGLYMADGRDSRIIKIISLLKNNINESFSIEELAKRINMSISSLHRHFKNLTGFSPLQYQKRLRLYEAQRLMLAENEHADRAALAVGYESITQFNREYKRMFGEPPKRDVNRRKGNFLKK